MKLKGRVVNESLTDGDFQNRRQIITKEAEDAWMLGKQLGLSANCEDKVVIESLCKLNA